MSWSVRVYGSWHLDVNEECVGCEAGASLVGLDPVRRGVLVLVYEREAVRQTCIVFLFVFQVPRYQHRPSRFMW